MKRRILGGVGGSVGGVVGRRGVYSKRLRAGESGLFYVVVQSTLHNSLVLD